MQLFDEEFLREAEERQKKRLMEATRQYARRDLQDRVLGQGLTERDREAEIRFIAQHIRYASVTCLGGWLMAGHVFSVEQRKRVVREVLAELEQEKGVCRRLLGV